MTAFNSAKWIWTSEAIDDSYVDFVAEFSAEKNNGYTIRISCDTDYTLFVNGKFVNSNQYGDYEHYKIFDEINLNGFIEKNNEIKILAYHDGVGNSRHKANTAGLIFEVFKDGKTVCASSQSTLARLNPAYKSGAKKLITHQLGFTFYYDANYESNDGYTFASIINKECKFFPRPIEKLKFSEPVSTLSIKKASPTLYRIDLGGEKVGIPKLRFNSSKKQTVILSWGERLVDGQVRRIISNRDFSFTYVAKEGENEFCNYMLRLGCRYIEVVFEEEAELQFSFIEQYYPTKANPAVLQNALDQKIYDVCLNTLNKCMMEHYVDCPWREQSFYAFDSRNQILCGYYAFENGNADYVRANLELICNDEREDGLLSICYPCSTNLAIPSFSLHFFTAMLEYAEFTQDISLAKKYNNRLKRILDAFISREKNGLIQTFEGAQYWNFYDWTKYCEGSLFESEKINSDCILNCLVIQALNCYEKLCALCSEPFPFVGKATELSANVRKTFLNDDGLFVMHSNTDELCAFACALAVYTKVATKEESIAIAKAITENRLIKSTLSTKFFVYEALLYADENYKDYIIDDIRSTYKIMLDAGSDTVWETADGEADFHNAGSLCHGWSAIPVYFYNKFKMVK